MPPPQPTAVDIHIPSPAPGQPGINVGLDLASQHLTMTMADPAFAGPEYFFYPTLAQIKQDISGFASAALLMAKAKQFDDGLLAAVEMLCQNGNEDFCGKKRLLKQLASSLKRGMDNDPGNVETGDLARSFLRAAGELGGATIDEDLDIVSRAEDLALKFLEDERKAKPISFYTWSAELGQIFQQDRFLQTSLTELAYDLPALLTTALAGEPQTSKCYATLVELIQKLTNPYPGEYRDLRHVVDIDPAIKYSLFPPSRSVEMEIAKKLFPGETAVPENFSLIDVMVQEIQAGHLSLDPSPDSGWLDYQLWAREPLVIPDKMAESAHLEWSASYREKLVELFKAAVALLRESHIKQLEIGEFGSLGDTLSSALQPYMIRPQLTVEPLATYYLRQARSYQFVRQVLEDIFGSTSLQKISRLHAQGPSSTSLDRELADMESLFFGLYLVAMAEIGGLATIDQRGADQQQQDIDHARKWLATYGADPDLARDNRMMVPIFYDKGRQKTKVWVMLGYSVAPLAISYKQTPDIGVITDESARPFPAEQEQEIRRHIEFAGVSKWLVTPVTKEMYVDKILNREEFRHVCDEIQSTPEIIKVLSGELSLQEVKADEALATVYPYLMRCNELGGGYLTLEDGSFHLLSPDHVARFLCCDGHYLVENQLAVFLAGLHLPGLTIGEPPVLHNRKMDRQYDSHKELLIANRYQREASGKRELRQDNIWRWSSGIMVSASLQEKLTAAGFAYLGFREDNWD